MNSSTVDFRTFGNNTRGWSLEIQQSCGTVNNPVDCSVVFDHARNVVTRFGYFGRAQFPSDPDIAGVGIYAALLCQAFIIWLFAVISVVGRGKREAKDRDNRFSLFFSISDVSTILCAVYVFNFMAKGKCTMSVYHYYVALDSVLIACSTMVVAFATSERHFWTTLAEIPRFLLTLATFIVVGIFLGYQAAKHLYIDFPSWVPPDIHLTHDSALLLPVSCFLDPDLIAYASPYAPSTPLTGDQLNRIGRPVKAHRLPQLYIYLFLSVAFVLGIVAHVYKACSHLILKRQYSKTNRNKWETALFSALWNVIFSVCFATDVFCAWQIYGLGKWARESGWMEDGAEDGFYSIGQLLPIFSLVLIGLALLERFKTKDVGHNIKEIFQDWLSCFKPRH